MRTGSASLFPNRLVMLERGDGGRPEGSRHAAAPWRVPIGEVVKLVTQREDADSRDTILALLAVAVQPLRAETYHTTDSDVSHMLDLAQSAIQQMTGQIDKDALQALRADLEALTVLTARGVFETLLPALATNPAADLREVQQVLREQKSKAQTREFTMLLLGLLERINAHERAKKPEAVLAHNLIKELAVLASAVRLAKEPDATLREQMAQFIAKLKRVGTGHNIDFVHEVVGGLMQCHPWLHAQHGAAAAE